MTVALKKKAESLLTELKPRERIELADMLYASVPDEFDEKWDKEIDRRLDEYEAGRAKLLTSEESFARARKALREARRAPLRRKS
jgi:putative addiction module component (TIGR02574 family)